MDSNEDQQVLAWQQIIRNRAFYDVRVQRGESWVDAACRTLDELIDQKEQAENSLSEFLASQLTSRDDIDRALINVTSNAMNYPTPSQMLGKDTGPLRRKCVDAVCELFGIETKQAVDPIEAKARELHEVAAPAPYWTWEALVENAKEPYRRMARYVLGQEDRHVDQ